MQAKILNHNRNPLEHQSKFYQSIAKIQPKIVQKSFKNRSKIDQKSMKNRSKSVPDALLERSWGHLGPGSQQEAEKPQKNRRKTAQNRPTWAPKSTKFEKK